VNTDTRALRYESLSIALHWLMLLLIAAVYSCMELRDFFPKGSDLRVDMKAWHFMLGISVLVLLVARVIVRLMSAASHIEPKPPKWQTIFASWTHVALYAWMVAMPLLGWLTISAEGKMVSFFGLELPQLISASESVADWTQELHEGGGTVGYFLIGLHAAAALFHHYVVRDNTLRRMLPRAPAH
jgi:cytochrome b561